MPFRFMRPFVRVVLPVAAAAVLVCLAVINVALVKTWRGELEDGVLWRQDGANVVASEVAPAFAGARAGIAPGDVVLLVDGQEIRRPADVTSAVHAFSGARPLTYVVKRASLETPIAVALLPMPLAAHGLYYSLALVGILA